METFTQVGAAKYVGTSKQQMYRYTKTGRIKLNRDGRIEKHELDQFLRDQLSKYGADGRDLSSQEKRGVVRGMHDLTLHHFTVWLYQEMAPALSGLLAEKKVPKKENLEICKEFYKLILFFTFKYNSEDILNKFCVECDGEDFDQIHYRFTGERIKSKPSDLKLQLPKMFLDLLTPKERGEADKTFRERKIKWDK